VAEGSYAKSQTERPLLSGTYQEGLGLDGPPPPARIRRTVAETVAVGAHPVMKGAEYHDHDGAFTVLIADPLAGALEAVGEVLRWVAANPWIRDGRPDPEVLVPYDGVVGWNG
jgi:hypothetical protein